MWPRSRPGMADMLLGGIMAMLAQNEHRKERARAEDLTEAMERLGFERRRLGQTSAIVRADGTAINDADTKLLADTVVEIAKEREAREAEVKRLRAEVEAKQRAEDEAKRKAEYDVAAAPFREARRLRAEHNKQKGVYGTSKDRDTFEVTKK